MMTTPSDATMLSFPAVKIPIVSCFVCAVFTKVLVGGDDDGCITSCMHVMCGWRKNHAQLRSKMHRPQELASPRNNNTTTVVHETCVPQAF